MGKFQGVDRHYSYGLLGHYTGSIDCCLKIWQKEGIRGFYKGVLPSLLKAGMSTGITFASYEYSRMMLVTKFPDIFKKKELK